MKMSDPWVCFGWAWVRNTAVVRSWSPPISSARNASADRQSVLLTIVMYSRNDSSGLSWLSATSSKLRPAAAGANRWRPSPQSLEPATPMDSSMATSRVNSAAFLGAAHSPAGVIASSSGSATLAPAPRRKVRRGRCFRVMKFMSPLRFPLDLLILPDRPPPARDAPCGTGRCSRRRG